jgi:hypothetical protein
MAFEMKLEKLWWVEWMTWLEPWFWLMQVPPQLVQLSSAAF